MRDLHDEIDIRDQEISRLHTMIDMLEIRVKELRHEMKMQIGHEGFRVRDIAVTALEKIENSTGMEVKREKQPKVIAAEALDQIKGR